MRRLNIFLIAALVASLAQACAIDSRLVGSVSSNDGGPPAEQLGPVAPRQGSPDLDGGRSEEASETSQPLVPSAMSNGPNTEPGRIADAGDLVADEISSALPPCSGCAELVVVLSEGSQSAYFNFELPDPGLDFTGGSVTWRVQVPEGSNGVDYGLSTIAQNGAEQLYAIVAGNYATLTAENFPPGEWRDISFDLSPYPPEADAGLAAFDNRRVQRIGINVGSTPTFAGTSTVRLLIDSVTYTGVPTVDLVTFTSSLEGLALNTFQVPPGTLPPILHP